MDRNVRLDGWDSDEDAAAAYMSHVGILRLRIERAAKALEDDDPTEAAHQLEKAREYYRQVKEERNKRIEALLIREGYPQEALDLVRPSRW